jgi:hypothetical protein
MKTGESIRQLGTTFKADIYVRSLAESGFWAGSIINFEVAASKASRPLSFLIIKLHSTLVEQLHLTGIAIRKEI